MTFSPFLAFLKMRSVKWTLVGVAIALVGLPAIISTLPYMFPDSRAKSGSYLDVVEMKTISKLSVQRLDFSKVCTSRSGTNTMAKLKKLAGKYTGWSFSSSETDNLDDSEVWVRRIMRGHVTTSLDFSKITTNSIDGKLVIEFPELVAEPFIDQWIYYDSHGTDSDHDPREMTKDMDCKFQTSMIEAALQPERVARAKEQAVHIVKMLYPDMEEFVAVWQDDKKNDQSDEGGDTNE